MNRCRNCEAPLEATFCPRCGQKDLDLERPLHQLIGEVLRESFDIDGRAARTVRTLFSRPGELTARYLAGHRRQFTPPVRLYLVVSVAFFLVVAWVTRQGMLFDISSESAGEVRVLTEDLPQLMFVFLPVFALLLKALYRQRFYFDHLIHALHLHTAAYVVLIVLLPLERAAERHWVLLGLQMTLFAYLTVYLAISQRRVYRSSWTATMLKTFALLFAYSVVLAMTLEFASSLDGAWPG